jgi:hypothetical protein
MPINDGQIQTVLRLAAIFSPEAKRQLDNYTRRRPQGGTDGHLRFVHYTSATNARCIIGTKRMWMRNARCMSDFSEVQHGLDIFDAFFKDFNRKKSFTSVIDQCFPGATQEALGQFEKWRTDLRLNSYITCISEHDDLEDRQGRLSMWRAFGGDAPRVAVIFKFNVPILSASELRLIFSPVAYLSDTRAHAILDEVAQNVKAEAEFLESIGRETTVRMIFQTFVAGVTCLKHEAFHEEREWRAIYLPNLYRSKLIECKVENVGPVPQRVYKIPLDVSASEDLADVEFSRIFDRLIIGPSSYPWVMYEAFVDDLEKAGVRDAKERVWVSKIPIRA